MNLKKQFLLIVFITQFSFSQEGIAVYSDYLSDNYYLLHPSMAGIADCAKLRLTGRQQWFGQDDAPALQTLSFNTSLGEDSRSGIGAIFFNDRNGYHSQTGAKLTYAHHLRFSRSKLDLNQLSFGINAALIQSNLDETSFTRGYYYPDPIVSGTMIQKDSYFNVDLGASYFFLDFYTHFTVKNVIANKRELYTDIETDNLRKYLWSFGYVFSLDNNGLLLEPSTMFQFIDVTKEKTVDINLKVYKNLEFGRVWGGVSYRQSFDGKVFDPNDAVGPQKLQYITPIVGLNYQKFMVAYTYSYLSGNVKFDNGGFHQITLGIDLFCKDSKYDCNCPAVN
ncbi:MAG TPA: hypothetical protein DDZ41_08420 [Flavobacterium sp.]|nr:hypothetical protein [Flavobacterium sp.]